MPKVAYTTVTGSTVDIVMEEVNRVVKADGGRLVTLTPSHPGTEQFWVAIVEEPIKGDGTPGKAIPMVAGQRNLPRAKTVRGLR